MPSLVDYILGNIADSGEFFRAADLITHVLAKKEVTDCVIRSWIATHEESTHGDAASLDSSIYDRFAILTTHPIS